MIRVKLTASEISLIYALLVQHEESGEYWGNQAQHYKAVQALMTKLEEIINP